MKASRPAGAEFDPSLIVLDEGLLWGLGAQGKFGFGVQGLGFRVLNT